MHNTAGDVSDQMPHQSQVPAAPMTIQRLLHTYGTLQQQSHQITIHIAHLRTLQAVPAGGQVYKLYTTSRTSVSLLQYEFGDVHQHSG